MEFTDVQKVFIERLRQLLSEKNMSNKEIAQELGMKPTVLAGYMSNNANTFREPSFTTLVFIARRFGVSTDYLLGLMDNETHQLESIDKVTGLTKESIYFFTRHKNLASVYNFMISNMYFYNLLHSLKKYGAYDKQTWINNLRDPQLKKQFEQDFIDEPSYDDLSKTLRHLADDFRKEEEPARIEARNESLQRLKQ